MDAEDRLELIGLLVEDNAWEAIVKIGQAILDHYYSADVFTGESKDIGPEYVVALRNALARIREVDSDNEPRERSGP
jgi:hypothetical protein